MSDGQWRVTAARFEESAAKRMTLPVDELPELAVAGRSNVGKSSLINRVTNTRALARVSRSPGRTALLNSFVWSARCGDGPVTDVRCVDLPGYGFAKVARDVREGFADMVEDYLLRRDRLAVVLLLIDCRREFDDRDQALVDFLGSVQRPTPIRVLLVGTKADKLGAAERGLWITRTAASSGLGKRDIHLTSTSSSIGIDGPRGLVQAVMTALVP
jgi:GTP-binding protein